MVLTDELKQGDIMPAIARLKTMPKNCIDCPFRIFDEMGCSILEYNGVQYESETENDLGEIRRKECPLIHMGKGKAMIFVDEEKLRV